MEANKEILREVTYQHLEPSELRKAQIPAESISAARIDIQIKRPDCDYGLFYYNYQNKFELHIADGKNVLFYSRYSVHKRIEDILKTKRNKGTNVISLEKAMDSERLAELTEKCKNYFEEVEIARLYLWEIKESSLPKEKISTGRHRQWFFESYAPETRQCDYLLGEINSLNL